MESCTVIRNRPLTVKYNQAEKPLFEVILQPERLVYSEMQPDPTDDCFSNFVPSSEDLVFYSSDPIPEETNQFPGEEILRKSELRKPRPKLEGFLSYDLVSGLEFVVGSLFPQTERVFLVDSLQPSKMSPRALLSEPYFASKSSKKIPGQFATLLKSAFFAVWTVLPK